jgi:hypothetical protein
VALADRHVVLLCRLLAVALGAVNTGAAIMEQAMGHDGINYLDQGDAWWRGDWSTAVNGSWSPLYPVLLGAALRVVKPPVGLEFPVVHVVNFVVYVAAVFAFEFFWKETAARYYGRGNGDDVLPRWAFTSIGYAAFVWVALCLVRVFVVTPDMLFAAMMLLAFGWMIRLRSEDIRWFPAVWFGLAIGAAYLAKGAAWPILIAMLATGVAGLVRSRPWHVAAAAGGLAAVAAPFVVALSSEAGRFTLGDAGRVLYLSEVLRVPSPPHRDMAASSGSLPAMDVAQTTPPVFRYPSDAAVTYPPSYERASWYAGFDASLRPALQWNAIAANTQRYFELFVRLQGISLAALAVLLIVRGRRAMQEEARSLLVISVAAVVFHGLVYVEGRYVAPFIVALWAAALLTLRCPGSLLPSAWMRGASIVIISGFVINIGVFHLDGLNAMLGLSAVPVAGPVSRNDTGPDKATDVAHALRAAGLSEGDRIGIIGDAVHASWARLVRLRIAAEVSEGDASGFWLASASEQLAVLDAFAHARVRAVLGQSPPPGVSLDGWTRLGTTSWYLRLDVAATPPRL